MKRQTLAHLSADQRAIVEPHVRALQAAQRGLSLALQACVPEAREAGAQFDVGAMQVYRMLPQSGKVEIQPNGANR